MPSTLWPRSFDPYRVETWSCFIEQDDPRAVTCDLRFAVESAFDVHAYSAKCRQSVLKSMLLWASLARAQRRLVPWDSEDNIDLGQGLVQHMLDLTAETQGVNSDEIYAALHAEQHPFLKKMHELQQARAGAASEWRGPVRAPVIAAARSTTYAISPTPAREPSVQAPLRAPTVLAESNPPEERGGTSRPVAAELVEAAAPPAPVPTAVVAAEEPAPVPRPQPLLPNNLEAPPPADGGAAHAAAAAAAAAPVPVGRAATPPESPLRNGFATANGAAAPPSLTRDSILRKTTPPVVTPASNGHTAAPTAPAPATAAAAKAPQSQTPPPSYAAATGNRVGAAPQPARVKAPALNGTAKGPAAPKAVAPPPSYGAERSAPAVAAAKAPAKAPPAAGPRSAAAVPSPSPVAEEPARFVAKRPAYTYTDSDAESSVAEAEAPPPPSRAAAAPLQPHSQPLSTTPVSVETLRKYGDGGREDLMQAFWNDLPADADGVPAWFVRRLAITAEDRSVPLAVSPVAPLSLDQVRSCMEAKAAKRLDSLVALLCDAVPAPLPPHEEAAALLGADDVAALCAAGLIRRSKQTAGDDTVLAFSVVETTASTPLRRFLAWPRGSNESAIQSGYEPNIPLKHISTYLNAVNAPSGSVQRFARLFDQIELSPKAQECFVFTDAQQQRWCLTRLPLGHVVATEIAQIVLSTLCGHSSYALKAHVLPNTVHVDVWVHTVRFSGPAGAVQAALEQLREACDMCGAVPSRVVGAGDVKSASYDFVGVHYDHATHTVSVVKELIGRLEAPRRSISTRDLERQYTQLLFCSATGHVAASEFYKVLRTVCHRLASLQQHPQQLHAASLLPEDAFAQLQRWHAVVSRNKPRAVEEVPLPSMSLFVELTTEHWQAVLVSDETQETWNAEGSLEDVLGTRLASASIAQAITCFRPCIENGAHISIKIIGGAALGRNDKPIYKNETEEGISQCIRMHLVSRTFSFEVAYLDLGAAKAGGPPAAAGNKKHK